MTYRTASRSRVRRPLALLGSSLLILAACSSAAPSGPAASTAANGSGPAPVASSGDRQALGTGGGPNPEPALEADSATKIAAAQAAGTIDGDTALLYDVYASLDYANLPAEYRSSNPAAPEANLALAGLAGRLDQLSPAIRSAVTPFLLRPDDPASFWQARLARPAAAGGIRLAAFAEGIPLEFIDPDETQVRVWYAAPLGSSERDLAVRLADEIDSSQMWAKEKAAMLGHQPCGDLGLAHNGGSSRLDIYLVYPSTNLDFGGRSDVLGFSGEPGHEQPNNGITITDGPGDGPPESCPVATHILLNATADFDHLKSTLAHELFHAFQLSFQHAWEAGRTWWAEATGMWATHLVYPKLNFEQARLRGYLSEVPGPEGPLDSIADAPLGAGAGQRAYAAYLLALYLVQKSGDPTGTTIGQTWLASQTKTSVKVLSSLPSWDTLFEEFSLWNWNHDSVIKYVDAGEPIQSTQLRQIPTCIDSHLPTGGACPIEHRQNTIVAKIDHLSAQYWEGSVKPDTQKVTFRLGGLDQTGGAIQALLTFADGTSKVEDWTDSGDRAICINREHVTRIDVVISNSNVDDTQVSTIIPVETETTACSIGHYSMDLVLLKGHLPGPGHHELDAPVICSGNDALGWVVDGTYIPSEPDFPGGDVADFSFTTTKGQEQLHVTMVDHTSDSPTDWLILKGSQFDFQINEQASPMTAVVHASNDDETVSISVTCSEVDTF